MKNLHRKALIETNPTMSHRLSKYGVLIEKKKWKTNQNNFAIERTELGV